MDNAFRDSLILTGPTGSGKTALGIDLAERLDAEIVSMDSMALYRRMDIGTAKPTAAERQRVRHHLIDLREPWESASVAWWLEQARSAVADIEQRGKRTLFVGGTPLYLKALLRGLFEGPAGDRELRARLEDEARQAGAPALHARLARVDPVAAARLHPNDLRRIVRALEVHELTGKPISAWQQQWSAAADTPNTGPPRCLWLDLPRTLLYERINRRVDAMFAAGLVDEVAALRSLPQPLSREACQALGYKEVLAYLDGQATLDETITEVKIRSRNFAKRQISWFRHLPECRGVSPELTWQLWGLTMKS